MGKMGTTPTPAEKQQIIKTYGLRFGLTIFVETGTFRGDMIAAVKEQFQKIYSVELNERLYQKAKVRFVGEKHIYLIPGDSGFALKLILAQLQEPALFWLDAHALVDGVRGSLITPIMAELESIFAHNVQEHIILIDDARLFLGQSDYPLLAELEGWIKEKRPSMHWLVEDDIIRIIPNSQDGSLDLR